VRPQHRPSQPCEPKPPFAAPSSTKRDQPSSWSSAQSHRYARGQPSPSMIARVAHNGSIGSRRAACRRNCLLPTNLSQRQRV
jgi:hypothetical protein